MLRHTIKIEVYDYACQIIYICCMMNEKEKSNEYGTDNLVC
jgi:hypothetical protein